MSKSWLPTAEKQHCTIVCHANCPVDAKEHIPRCCAHTRQRQRLRLPSRAVWEAVCTCTRICEHVWVGVPKRVNELSVSETRSAARRPARAKWGGGSLWWCMTRQALALSFAPGFARSWRGISEGSGEQRQDTTGLLAATYVIFASGIRSIAKCSAISRTCFVNGAHG